MKEAIKYNIRKIIHRHYFPGSVEYSISFTLKYKIEYNTHFNTQSTQHSV